MITVYNILRCHTLGACLKSDRHTMLVATADKKHFAPIAAQITGVNVGGNIHSGKVTDMHWTVGIR